MNKKSKNTFTSSPYTLRAVGEGNQPKTKITCFKIEGYGYWKVVVEHHNRRRQQKVLNSPELLLFLLSLSVSYGNAEAPDLTLEFQPGELNSELRGAVTSFFWLLRKAR